MWGVDLSTFILLTIMAGWKTPWATRDNENFDWKLAYSISFSAEIWNLRLSYWYTDKHSYILLKNLHSLPQLRLVMSSGKLMLMELKLILVYASMEARYTYAGLKYIDTIFGNITLVLSYILHLNYLKGEGLEECSTPSGKPPNYISLLGP